MVTTALKSNAAWLTHALGTSPNPLRRRVDRIAAAITALLLTVSLMVLPAAVALGAQVHTTLSQEAAQAAATTHPVEAVLTTDAPTIFAGTDTTQQPDLSSAEARWVAADGPRSATITVPAGSLRGQPATVWIDQSGKITSAPPTPVSIMSSTLFLSFVALLLGLLCCAVLIVGVQRLAQLYGQRVWAQEWETMQRRGTGLQR
jgi:amino acid transporter